MKKSLTAVALAALLLATGEGFAESSKKLDERMSRFYLTPTREEFDSIQRGIQSHLRKFKAWEPKSGSGTLAAVFLARVSEKYHYPLLDIGDLDDTARSIVANDGSEIATYVHDDSQVDPGKIDIWWASYSATGETPYLDKILAQVADPNKIVAQAPDPVPPSVVKHTLVVLSANWSVASNCEQDPSVLEYVRSVLKRTPPPTNADAIRELLAKAGKHDR